MQVEGFYDEKTSTLSYVVWDPASLDAVIIDPVMDFDARAFRVTCESCDSIQAFVKAKGLHVHWILETHVHADHLSGQRVLRDQLGAKTAIGDRIREVQKTFAPYFGWGEDLCADGSQWDALVGEGRPLQAGTLTIQVIPTPGHTPACVTYHIGDAVFTGDALFMPDFGTGRCDFPGGSAEQLYDSIMKLYALDDNTRVFVGHDYQPGGRQLAFECTIGESRRENKHLRHDTPKDAFVMWRKERDATLPPPGLIFQSLQVNANGGRLPPNGPSGHPVLRIPVNVF